MREVLPTITMRCRGQSKEAREGGGFLHTMAMLEIVTPIVLAYVSGRIYTQFDGDKTLTWR